MSKEEKYIQFLELMSKVSDPLITNHMDLDSEENLDEKIAVLEQIIAGKPLKEIEGLYEVLGLDDPDLNWD